MAALDGPCATVPVLAVAWSSDDPAARLCQYAIVMPLLHPLVTGEEGGLAAVPFELRLRIVTQLADSLAVMHDLPQHLAALGGGAGGGGVGQGGAGAVAILHGDIKPANVLLDKPIAEWGAGGQPSARFADFGNAVLREGATVPLMRSSAARRWTPAYGHPALAATPAPQYAKVGIRRKEGVGGGREVTESSISCPTPFGASPGVRRLQRRHDRDRDPHWLQPMGRHSPRRAWVERSFLCCRL